MNKVKIGGREYDGAMSVSELSRRLELENVYITTSNFNENAIKKGETAPELIDEC